MSRITHQRLTSVSPPARRYRQNTYDELDYGRGGNQYVLINYRTSPAPMPRTRITYIEDVTNNNSSAQTIENIERETRSVQREMDTMLYRVAAGLSPRGSTPFSINHIPMRSASEVKEVADMRRLHVRNNNPGWAYQPLNKATLYYSPYIHYPDPACFEPKYYFIGRQNLACLSFAGGRPIPKRRRFYPGYDEYKIRDDVTFRSYYNRLRSAANTAAITAKNYVRATQYQPIHYSRKTIMGGNEPKREVKESKWVEKAMSNEKAPPPRRTGSTKLGSVKEPRRESFTKEPKMEPPAPTRQVNVTLPGPRKSISEIMKDDLPKKVQDLPEERIVLRRPSKLDAIPSTPPVKAEAEETFKIPKKVKEPSPPPREPTPPPKELTPPPKEPTPPPKEPTPPPKEPTPPPKEPTPPPKEPTPPPKEPTPPPKEPTPPPKEPTPPPPEPEPVVVEPEPEEVSPVVDEKSEASGMPEGSDVESNKGEGDVADIPLDEEVAADNEVCDAQNDLDLEEDPPAVVENGPVETAEPETAIDAESEIVESAQPEKEQVKDEVKEEVKPEPEKEEAEVEAEEAEKEVAEETHAREEEETPVVAPDGETPAGVSILVADIDEPVKVEVPQEIAQQEPMTVEQIQADAERRRTDFARLLEEHHEIVEKVELLEHQTELSLNPPELDNVEQTENEINEVEVSSTTEELIETSKFAVAADDMTLAEDQLEE